MPGYDKCPYCGHDWHGLPCAKEHQEIVDYRQYGRKCDCPSSFKEK